MAYAPREDPARSLLYQEPDAQRVLLFVTDKLASTALQVAGGLRMEPERTRDVLAHLQEAGLVDQQSGSTGPYGGVFTPTRAGVAAAWDLRSTKKR